MTTTSLIYHDLGLIAAQQEILPPFSFKKKKGFIFKNLQIK